MFQFENLSIPALNSVAFRGRFFARARGAPILPEEMHENACLPEQAARLLEERAAAIYAAPPAAYDIGVALLPHWIGRIFNSSLAALGV